MAAENHPLYSAWDKALGNLVEAERRYHIAKMEGRPEAEMEAAARELDVAREAYQAMSDEVDLSDAVGGSAG